MITGILQHVYHLGAQDWEWLAWGDPERDQLGTGTKLIEYLLTAPRDEEIVCVTYSGPSSRDGKSEGEYTKQFLLDKFDELDQFPKFKDAMQRLSLSERTKLKKQLEDIVLGEQIPNTYEEIRHAADYFNKIGAQKVVHVAAASHAPRCIQLQAVVRSVGLIPLHQQWFTVASDVCFGGTKPEDVMILEPPHRPDDPLLDFEPTLPQVLRPFPYALSPAAKKTFIQDTQAAMQKAVAASQNDS